MALTKEKTNKSVRMSNRRKITVLLICPDQGERAREGERERGR